MNNNDIILRKKLSFSHGYLTKEKYIEIDKNGNITVKKRDYSNDKHSEYKNFYSTNDNIPISPIVIKILDVLLVSPTIITDGRTMPIKDPFDEILKMFKYIKEHPEQSVYNSNNNTNNSDNSNNNTNNSDNSNNNTNNSDNSNNNTNNSDNNTNNSDNNTNNSDNNTNNNTNELIDNYNKIKNEHLKLESKLSDFEINYTNLKEEHTNLNHAYNALALMNNNLNCEYNKIKQELTNTNTNKVIIDNNIEKEEINLLKAEITMYKTKETLSLNEILELKNANHKLKEDTMTNNNNEKEEVIINNEKEQEINVLKAEINMYKTKEHLSLNEILTLKNMNHKVNEENFNLKEAITNLNQNITILNKSNEDIILRKRIKELEEINKNLEGVNKLNTELTNRISHLLDEINEKNLDNKKLLMNYTNLNDQYQKLLDKHLKVSELKNISKYFKN
jgi:hypothetical protein